MERLQILFSTLVIYDYNIRMLHWKVSGIDFGTKHELMDAYHSELNSMIDEVGEMILMLHGLIPSFAEINLFMSNSPKSFLIISGKENYDSKTVMNVVNNLFTDLIQLIDDTKSSNLPSDIISKLEELQYWLRKETRYKLDSTLIQ